MITKVLADCFKKVLENIISPEQTTYVEGMDDAFSVNDVFSWIKMFK